METLVRLILLVPVTVTSQLLKEAVLVTAAIGSDVVLPCVSEDKLNVKDLIMDWRKEEDEIYIFLEEKTTFPHKGYKDRASVFTVELQNGIMSLKLSGVKQTDEGWYRCCYDHGHDGRICANVTVIVTETPTNHSDIKDSREEPGLRPHATVTAGVCVLLCFGIGAGYVLWKRLNGCGSPDETQTNQAETTSLTVVTMSNGDDAAAE